MLSKVSSPTFIPQELKDGGGWYVVATLSDGRVGFRRPCLGGRADLL